MISKIRTGVPTARLSKELEWAVVSVMAGPEVPGQAAAVETVVIATGNHASSRWVVALPSRKTNALSRPACGLRWPEKLLRANRIWVGLAGWQRKPMPRMAR